MYEDNSIGILAPCGRTKNLFERGWWSHLSNSLTNRVQRSNRTNSGLDDTAIGTSIQGDLHRPINYINDW